MKILAIDTSGTQANVAILLTNGEDYIIVGETTLNARTGEKSWTHSEILMPGVDSLLNLTGLDISSIDYIAYTQGPGSFTGLRIGASTALGLANGLNKPCIPVPTLDALAYNMLDVASHGYVVPMMDARRGQVYSAVYAFGQNRQLTRITDYLALPVGEMLEQIPPSDNIYLLGDGVCANKDAINIGTFVPPHNNRQRASSLAICAADMIKNGFTKKDTVEILYIRAPQAERDLHAKNS